MIRAGLFEKLKFFGDSYGIAIGILESEMLINKNNLLHLSNETPFSLVGNH